MANQDFKVGDEVAVFAATPSFDFPFAPHNLQKIIRLTKTFVELDNISRWKLDGDEHPRAPGRMQAHICLATDEHRVQYTKKRQWAAIVSRFELLRHDPSKFLDEHQMAKLFSVMLELVRKLDKGTGQ
jgi:hypothetical protein